MEDPSSREKTLEVEPTNTYFPNTKIHEAGWLTSCDGSCWHLQHSHHATSHCTTFKPSCYTNSSICSYSWKWLTFTMPRHLEQCSNYLIRQTFHPTLLFITHSGCWYCFRHGLAVYFRINTWNFFNSLYHIFSQWHYNNFKGWS